jgi:hypothetical protein
MKHLVATLALIAIVAATTGFVSFRTSGDAAVQSALSKQDAMEWLRTDFQLTDAQFAAIKKLHDSYSIVCEEHCRQIQEATHSRNSLRKANADARALSAADRRVEELRLICESAIATHVRECATHMSPDASRRYLGMILPKIKDFDHLAAPSVQLTHGRH